MSPVLRARSDSPGTVLPLSVSVLCSEESVHSAGREESVHSAGHTAAELSVKYSREQNSISKHLSLTDSLEL